MGAAPVFGEGPLLRRRLGCTLTTEQLRSVPSRGTVPIGLQAWLGHGGPGGCRSLLAAGLVVVTARPLCVCVCVCVCLFVCLTVFPEVGGRATTHTSLGRTS